MGLKNIIVKSRNYVSDFFSKSKINRIIEKRQYKSTIPRETLVLLGTGWGGYSFLRHLDTKKYDIVVVSPRNHFLFTPLLASTTVGTLDFRSIADPIRTVRTYNDFKYIQAEVKSIDTEKKEIFISSKLHESKQFPIKFDKLVIGVGAVNNTFGIKGVKEHAHFLKELHHAREIRKKIIENFEQASLPDVSVEERERLLTFVITGGGPTGTEFTAELNDFFTEDIVRFFPFIPINEVKIILLEASGKILSAFDEPLVKKALTNFRNSGIDVRTHTAVKEVHKQYIELSDGSKIPYGLCVWSTGIGPSDLVKNSPFEKDKHGRIVVDDYLRVKGFDNIYSFGDCANVPDKNYPATAQVASQAAVYLAKEFNNQESLTPQPPKQFVFKFLGLLAYVGKKQGLFQSNLFDLSGWMAWITWRSAYLVRLGGGLRTKIQVPFDWTRTLIFGRDISNF